jgi:CRP/FNR family transcriptional regulator
MACNNVFLSVRQRVARHLLDLAVQEQPAGLVVHASHQDIADAIGSVREVVSRVIRELRTEGLVTRSGDTIVLPNPAGLVERQR